MCSEVRFLLADAGLLHLTSELLALCSCSRVQLRTPSALTPLRLLSATTPAGDSKHSEKPAKLSRSKRSGGAERKQRLMGLRSSGDGRVESGGGRLYSRAVLYFDVEPDCCRPGEEGRYVQGEVGEDPDAGEGEFLSFGRSSTGS